MHIAPQCSTAIEQVIAHMNQFKLTDDQILLNDCIINNLPIIYNRHNFLCSLIGFLVLLETHPFDNDLDLVIIQICSEPNLSLFFFDQLDNYDSLIPLVADYRLKFPNL